MMATVDSMMATTLVTPQLLLSQQTCGLPLCKVTLLTLGAVAGMLLPPAFEELSIVR